MRMLKVRWDDGTTEDIPEVCLMGFMQVDRARTVSDFLSHWRSQTLMAREWEAQNERGPV